MTNYPSHSEYNQAIENFSQSVLAPQFLNGSPVLNSRNQIAAYVGRNVRVYPINVNDKKLALRCWTRDPGAVKIRYLRAKKYLKSNPTSYIVDFDYVDEGITVKGNTYPISHMEWVDGKQINQFIDENINNTLTIAKLADNFLTMVKELHSKNISHGDLHDGHILVLQNSPTFELRLVGYDCLYVPTLQGLSNQVDLPWSGNFQHPKRHKKSNGNADYFSELVIYLSLLAYAEKPSLWHHKQWTRLLFSDDDFMNPSGSSRFHTLSTLSPLIRSLSNTLREYCLENDTNRLMPLEQAIANSPISNHEDEDLLQRYTEAPQLSQSLSIFLCHSSNDKLQVRELYNRLRLDQFDPWLDEEKLIPGQDWQNEILKAVRKAHVVLVCLSRGSITKSGYVQKEITYALDVAGEQPEGKIFLIPVKLEECEIPERLRRWQWVNYFEKDGYKKLLNALHLRSKEK